MLRWFKTVKELDFRRLMSVYEEGNSAAAATAYPHLPPLQGIMQAEEDFYQYLREIFFHTEGAAYAVWEENGAYICALRLEPYRDGLLLTALETAPEFRRQGFAKRLICAVLAEHQDENIYSHVSKRNAPSLRAHSACGFRKILDYAVHLDGSVLTSGCTLLCGKEKN